MSLGRPWFLVLWRGLISFCLCSFSVLASAEPLTVLELEKAAEFRSDSTPQWEALKAGQQLELPVEVRTREGASVILEQAGSTFAMKPETRLSFAGSGTGGQGLISRIKHWIGTTFYKIERQPDSLSVETPFLVSTIKGTQFVIVSTEQESFVTLTEGSLQVLDLATGQKTMIVPGEVKGSSVGGASARTYQTNKAEAQAGGRSAEKAAGGARSEQGELMSAPARFGADNNSRNEAGLNSRGIGFDKGPKAIDEVRIDSIANSERRSEARGEPSVGGRPAGPGDNGGQPGVPGKGSNTGQSPGARPGSGPATR